MLNRYLDHLMPAAQAQALILSKVQPLGVERVPLVDALERTLAGAALADLEVPPFICSGVDGYAVIAADTTGATAEQPATLRALADLPAGSVPTQTLTAGHCVRLMTGAPLPPGADSVVMVEDTRRQDDGTVAFLEAIKSGKNYRNAGEDVKCGEVVVEPGTLIRPAELAMLAAVGMSEVPVYRRPRVAIIPTGDELADVTEVPPPGKIRDSNSWSMLGQVRKYGGVVTMMQRAVDTVEHLEARLDEAAQDADLILTSGGVSVGDYDLVKDVMERRGCIHFWGLAVKPGRPLVFGEYPKPAGSGSVFFFGLPGYPVSGMVTFEQFVRLSLLRMQGRRLLQKPSLRARLGSDYRGSADKVDFLRVNLVQRMGEWWAELAGVQGSGRLSSMVRANALLVLPAGVSVVKQGDWCDAQLTDAPEIA